MDNVHIKPRENVQVRDPLTGRALKTRGEKKPRTSYWLRRLRDGDVILVDPSTPATRAKGGKS